MDDINIQFKTFGTIYSFGNGDCGQLGHEMPNLDDPNVDFYAAVNIKKPKVLDTVKDIQFQNVICGGMHNIAIERSEGCLYSWGMSDTGVLGRIGSENIPLKIQFKTRVLKVSAGDKHSALIDIYGDIYVWGAYGDKDGRNWFYNEENLQKSLHNEKSTPTKLELPEKCISIASGSNHTITLSTTGQVYSWGIGDLGQLGRKVCEMKDEKFVYKIKDVAKQHLVPKLVDFEISKNIKKSAKHISCGSYHSFIISEQNQVYGTGMNQYAQLSLDPKNTMIEKFTHLPLLDAFDLKFLAGGEHFSIGLSQDGYCVSFGRCDQNQLGIDLSSYPSKLKPGEFVRNPQIIELKPNKIVESLSCGSAHTILITEDKEAFSFGFGESNQLGHNKEKDETLPKKITTFKGKIMSVACGGQHSVILAQQL